MSVADMETFARAVARCNGWSLDEALDILERDSLEEDRRAIQQIRAEQSLGATGQRGRA